MKEGDFLKYRGEMNPYLWYYKFIDFNTEYEITKIDGDIIELKINECLKKEFFYSEIINMFTLCNESKDIHYNNENGSLYLFANQHELNAYEFDVIKRIVRCRKKGQFRDDLEKTIRVIELYLKETE
jgi:hypothetical protein